MLKKAGEPVTEIPPDNKPRTLAEALMLLNVLYPLTDEEAADWLRDIEEMRGSGSILGVPDPWES